MDKMTASTSLWIEGLIVHAFLLGWAGICLLLGWGSWTGWESIVPTVAFTLAGLVVPLIGLGDWWTHRIRQHYTGGP